MTGRGVVLLSITAGIGGLAGLGGEGQLFGSTSGAGKKQTGLWPCAILVGNGLFKRLRRTSDCWRRRKGEREQVMRGR